MTGPTAHLVLADGTRFRGTAVGATGATVGEAVFTTGMTGYQEVLTDPSYCGQIVTMTAPQIGNTGVNAEDSESRKPFVAGFVMRELSPATRHWRSEQPLDTYLERQGIAAIEGVDTRALTTHIRDAGAQMAAIGTEDPSTLCDRARAAPPMQGRDLTGEVTCAEAYDWTEGLGGWATGERRAASHRVIAIDYGAKRGILRCLAEAGCELRVVPATTTAAQVLAAEPDGIFLSNGPGDPAAVEHAVGTVRELLGKRPIFGICLGHQILCLALGGKSHKLKFGHRGLNQPVKDLTTGKVEVTSQNHGFVVDAESLSGLCDVTHLHLNDGTCEGISHRDSGAFGVQYHPEASAGPHDARYLFQRFVDSMQDHR